MIGRILRFLPSQIYRAYCQYLNRKEYAEQKYNLNERTIEYRFIFEALQKTWPKTVLDVGTGVTSLPHLIRICGYEVTAIDNIKDYWPRGFVTSTFFNRHYYVIDDDVTKTRLPQKFDFIACISTVEHIADYKKAMDGMFGLLKSGGHLVLTFPYTEDQYCENVYLLPESSVGSHVSYICQSFSRKQLNEWCAQYGAEIVAQEYWRCFDGKFWSTGKAIQPQPASASTPHQMSCVLIRKK